MVLAKFHSLLGIAAAALAVGVFLMFAGTASAQEAGYIRVVGPKGQMEGASTNPMYKGWIVVRSVVSAPSPSDATDRESSAPSVSEITVTKTLNAATTQREASSGMAIGKTATSTAASSAAVAPRDQASGMASGKRMHKPITITKEVDKASPLLRELAASGEHLSEVDIVLNQAGGQPAARYKLIDAMISSIQSAGAGGGERPTETVSFSYQKIEIQR